MHRYIHSLGWVKLSCDSWETNWVRYNDTISGTQVRQFNMTAAQEKKETRSIEGHLSIRPSIHPSIYFFISNHLYIHTYIHFYPNDWSFAEVVSQNARLAHFRFDRSLASWLTSGRDADWSTMDRAPLKSNQLDLAQLISNVLERWTNRKTDCCTHCFTRHIDRQADFLTDWLFDWQMDRLMYRLMDECNVRSKWPPLTSFRHDLHLGRAAIHSFIRF